MTVFNRHKNGYRPPEAEKAILKIREAVSKAEDEKDELLTLLKKVDGSSRGRKLLNGMANIMRGGKHA